MTLDMPLSLSNLKYNELADLSILIQLIGLFLSSVNYFILSG